MPPSSRPRRSACAALLAAALVAGCGSEDPQLTRADATRLADGIERVRSAADDGRLRAAIAATTRLRASFGELEGRGVFAPEERTALRTELRRLDAALGRRREEARARARAAAARKRALEQQRQAEAIAAAQAAAAQQQAAAQQAAEDREKRDERKDDRRADRDATEEQETGGAEWDREEAGRGREKPGKKDKHGDRGGGKGDGRGWGGGDDDD